MKDFRDLKVWQKSHQLVIKVYKATSTFPKEEIYGLTSQIRRSCISITANIAEGCGRGSDADFARFLQMAVGSASELEYYILLCRDIDLLNPSDYECLYSRLNDVKRMLISLIQKLKPKNQF